MSKLVEFLESLAIDNIDFAYYLQGHEPKSFDELWEILEDQRAFDVEIIYYSSAIKYLQENDPSLRESLDIAHEYGMGVEHLNSETLASLLASRNCRDEFYSYQTEIESFFEELEELNI